MTMMRQKGARKGTAIMSGQVQSSEGHISGMARATQRPAHVKAPAHWEATPLPAPQPVPSIAPHDQPEGRDPVRYGDWELKGVAVDF